MQPENLDIRKQKIRFFAFTYTGLILLGLFYFYGAFVKIPELYRTDQAISTAQMNDFLKRTGEVDQLVMEIQNKPNVKEKSVLEFYEWINSLKETYSRPLYNKVLDSYHQRVIDIEFVRSKDTLLLGLQQQYKLIRTENTALLTQNVALKEELSAKKTKKE